MSGTTRKRRWWLWLALSCAALLVAGPQLAKLRPLTPAEQTVVGWWTWDDGYNSPCDLIIRPDHTFERRLEAWSNLHLRGTWTVSEDRLQLHIPMGRPRSWNAVLPALWAYLRPRPPQWELEFHPAEDSPSAICFRPSGTSKFDRWEKRSE